MDPLSHVVIGRALTAAVDDDPRLFSGRGTAAILGALAPDVDGILIPFGWDRYLCVHEVGTHSIAGGLLVAFVTAAIVHAFARRTRWLPLAAAAAAGAMSHLALDLLSGARIRLAWPFVEARRSVPLMAMADPWFMAICVAGVFAWWLRSRGLTGVGLGSDPGSSAFALRATVRQPSPDSGSPSRSALARYPARRLVARAVLAAAAALLCVKGALLLRAIHSASVPMMSLSTLDARWGSFTEWNAFERTPAGLRTWLVNSDGSSTLIASHRLEPETALVKASRSLETVGNFLRTHDFGFPVERSSDGTTSVLWSDLRYCWPTTPSPDSIACALWFGGVFGQDGRVVTQEVRLGSWVQKRPASR